MEESTVKVLIELLKQNLSKPDGVVVAAYITVGGMVAAAVVAALVQWLVTRNVLRSEHKRLQTQLKTDSAQAVLPMAERFHCNNLRTLSAYRSGGLSNTREKESRSANTESPIDVKP